MKKNKKIKKMFLKNYFWKRHLALGRQIGRGSFGTVYLCTLDNKTCVAKVVKITRENCNLLRNEAAIWKILNHENVCQLFETLETKHEMTFVCERLGETLRDRHVRMLKLGATPRMHTLVKGWLDIASALAYVHEQTVIHRDVKSENIFVDFVGEDSTQVRLKLSDFGLSKYENADDAHTAETGSYRFMSPEVIRHEKYNSKCDIYSMSLVFYEMLTFTTPFATLSPIQAALLVANEAKRPPLPPLPPLVDRMLAACWSQAPAERPTARAVVQTLRGFSHRDLSFSSVQMGIVKAASAHAELCSREA